MRSHEQLAVGAVEDVGPVFTAPAFSTWLRTWGLHLELALAVTAGTGAAVLVGPRPYVALVALVIWVVGSYHRGRAVTTPLGRQLKSVTHSAVLPLAMLAAAVGFFGLPAEDVPEAFASVSVAALTAIVCRGFRWRLQSPVRVVVAGDRAAVASAAARWARTPRVRVVGGLLVEPGLDESATPREILGVPTVLGLGEARERMQRWGADLCVVTPGAGMTPQVFRRLSWSLEGTRTSLGVSGVIESVASHRISAGGLERTSIIDVRPPRPSRVVRAAKVALDRAAGAVLLVLASPLLLALTVLVRLDSPGPALFRQVRIGQHGRPFKVYKLRTMVLDAEERREALDDVNEFDSVLFKMRRDPRVTRIGHLLRKSSLDELPQLINVVRGEMSLVGPRPYVPEEIEKMDRDTLRRLAVRPGITGLWQVSGRSDLDWDESSALDTYYADNWNLTADLEIGLRTIKAVVGGKGAY